MKSEIIYNPHDMSIPELEARLKETKEILTEKIKKRDQAKILIDDPVSNRFKCGDIGTLIENDFEKYAYHIELADGRSYYFHKGEVECIRFNNNGNELFRDKTTEGNENHE